MGETSKIEWTDATWNPIRARNRRTGKVGWHCTHASEGCRNCYAESMNKRLGTGLAFKPGHEADIEIFLDEEMLLRPLHWKKPRMIFVGSMTDLFADFVPDEWIDRIFTVMALTEQHTYQVLTKRAARMRSFASDFSVDRFGFGGDFLKIEAPWPLSNVWLGVSVEDQAQADQRIPDLLTTPSAIRFISGEPLLGPLDLSAFLRNGRRSERPWSGFDWPAWVPERVRFEVQDFWRTEWGRGPSAWIRGAIENGQPSLGQHGKYHLCRNGEPLVEGRFIPAWNNIGRVLDADGQIHCVSAGRWQLPNPYLDLAIVGGESGRNARPMHIDWGRSIRDQCATGGAGFFFKQWGEWGPSTPETAVDPNAGWLPLRGQLGAPAKVLELYPENGATYVERFGKKAAGRLLDGREHNDLPRITT